MFLSRVKQLLPVLGSDILVPLVQLATTPPGGVLFCRNKNAEGRGQRTRSGFVVFAGSTAVLEDRPSAGNSPGVLMKRKQLIAEQVLVASDGVLVFTKDVEFTSPSAAAVVIHGGSANGLTAWRNADGMTLKQLDEHA